jgi:hypothetical protein
VAYPLRDGALEKRSARCGVVAIVFEGIADRLRRDRRAGEVKDAANVVVAQKLPDERVVFHATFHEGRAWIHHPTDTGDEIIQDHSPESRVQQLQHGMASDIAGAARDQNTGPSRPTRDLFRDRRRTH